MTFFKGYLYVGSDQSLTVYKVTPSSSSVKNLPMQITASQNLPQEQQSVSPAAGDQTILTRIATDWNRLVNFFSHL